MSVREHRTRTYGTTTTTDATAAIALAQVEYRAAVQRLHDRTVQPAGEGFEDPFSAALDGLLDSVVEARARVRSAARSPVEQERGPMRLTRRQLEILRLVAQGVSTGQIAARLFLSRATVRNHVAAALRALGAHSRLEAVAIARHDGLL